MVKKDAYAIECEYSIDINNKIPKITYAIICRVGILFPTFIILTIPV